MTSRRLTESLPSEAPTFVYPLASAVPCNARQ